jgi:transposase
MIKRPEVQVLLRSGVSHREVSKRTGVSKRSVTRIAQENDIASLAPRSGARPVGRPGVARQYEAVLERVLGEQPDLPTVEVLHRLREAGYRGGKSAVYALVRGRRGPAPPRLMVRFEGVAGEFAQFDFGEVQVAYTTGKAQRLHFAAYRLKYSRWVYVEIVPDQQVEALTRSLLRAFETSGGTPLSVVFDNPKTVVLHPRQTPIVWNPTMAQLALDFAFAIELCTPRAANQKGSVENLVGWVKGSFFKVRRFVDFADLQQQLRAWHTEVNEERPCRATGIIPALRMEEERARLRPLAVAPVQYGLRFDVMVGPTGMVTYKAIRYAMPAQAIGIPATLHLYSDRVRITAGRHEVTHPRFPKQGISYPPEVRAQHLASVSGSRGRLYFQRQRLLELGPVVVSFLTELVHSRPRTWKGDVEALYALLERLGEEAFLTSVQNALLHGLIGAEYVKDLDPGRNA